MSLTLHSGRPPALLVRPPQSTPCISLRCPTWLPGASLFSLCYILCRWPYTFHREGVRGLQWMATALSLTTTPSFAHSCHPNPLTRRCSAQHINQCRVDASFSSFCPQDWFTVAHGAYSSFLRSSLFLVSSHPWSSPVDSWLPSGPCPFLWPPLCPGMAWDVSTSLQSSPTLSHILAQLQGSPCAAERLAMVLHCGPRPMYGRSVHDAWFLSTPPVFRYHLHADDSSSQVVTLDRPLGWLVMPQNLVRCTVGHV